MIYFGAILHNDYRKRKLSKTILLEKPRMCRSSGSRFRYFFCFKNANIWLTASALWLIWFLCSAGISAKVVS